MNFWQLCGCGNAEYSGCSAQLYRSAGGGVITGRWVVGLWVVVGGAFVGRRVVEGACVAAGGGRVVAGGACVAAAGGREVVGGACVAAGGGRAVAGGGGDWVAGGNIGGGYVGGLYSTCSSAATIRAPLP